jgi:hypothetical protein
VNVAVDARKVDHPSAKRVDGELKSGSAAGLSQRVRNMSVDCPFGKHKPRGDLGVAQTFDDEEQDLELACGE